MALRSQTCGLQRSKAVWIAPLALGLLLGAPASADAGEAEAGKAEPTPPVRLDPDRLAGLASSRSTRPSRPSSSWW